MLCGVCIGFLSDILLLLCVGELPQLNDGNFLVPKEEIIMHLQTVRARVRVIPMLIWSYRSV